MLGKAVIVVDDEPDILHVIQRQLEKQGYVAHGFTEPEKALAHAKDCKECSIIVSDVKMPRMTGFQLLRAVKTIRPDIKVVLMTAFEIHMKEWQQSMPSTSVDQFITKPFTGQQLVEAIENCKPVVRQS